MFWAAFNEWHHSFGGFYNNDAQNQKRNLCALPMIAISWSLILSFGLEKFWKTAYHSGPVTRMFWLLSITPAIAPCCDSILNTPWYGNTRIRICNAPSQSTVNIVWVENSNGTSTLCACLMSELGMRSRRIAQLALCTSAQTRTRLIYNFYYTTT